MIEVFSCGMLALRKKKKKFPQPPGKTMLGAHGLEQSSPTKKQTHLEVEVVHAVAGVELRRGHVHADHHLFIYFCVCSRQHERYVSKAGGRQTDRLLSVSIHGYDKTVVVAVMHEPRRRGEGKQTASGGIKFFISCNSGGGIKTCRTEEQQDGHHWDDATVAMTSTMRGGGECRHPSQPKIASDGGFNTGVIVAIQVSPTLDVQCGDGRRTCSLNGISPQTYLTLCARSGSQLFGQNERTVVYLGADPRWIKNKFPTILQIHKRKPREPPLQQFETGLETTAGSSPPKS